jgi:protein-disulfide isomerase
MSDENTAGSAARIRPKNNLGIPIAIVIAAALIASAIYFRGGVGSPTTITTTTPNLNDQVTPEVQVEPIRETDHVRGNPNAPIVLIEYSDFDCPFCKRFHEEVLQPLIDEYGTTGKVAWVYRHLPLEGLHPNAPLIAQASECVAEQAGNDGFWTFTDLVFGERGTNDQTNPGRLSEFAETAGANPATYELCLSSGKYEQMVNDSIDEAIAANGGPNRLGTPFTLVFVGNDYVGPIVGAQEYAAVKRNIDIILTQIEGGEVDIEEETGV